MRSFLVLSSLTTIVCATFPPAHVPTNVSFIEPLKFETDNTSNPAIFHDGGGSGSQAGYHVQVFADSYTKGSFVHNSVAYMGYRNASDPTDLYTFGMVGTAGAETFKGPFASPMPNSNETALGPYFSIWATSGLAALPDNKTLVGVFQALNETAAQTPFYSMMVTIDAVDPTTVATGQHPPSKRVAPQLFYPNEVNYGLFSTYVNGSFLYLVGADETGFKLARVAATADKIGDRSQYSYYNGSSNAWQATPMRLNDKTTNFFNWTSDFLGTPLYPVYGDLVFSAYHNTYLLVFSDNAVDGAVRVAYSTTGTITGQWAWPKTVYTPPVPAQCTNLKTAYNYAIHTHCGLDTTGNTLMLSYSSCANYVSMSRIHWV